MCVVVCCVLCVVFCAFSPLSAGPPLRRTTLFVTAPPQDRFRRTPLCVSAVCDRPSAGPPRRTAPPPDRPKFRAFFPPRHNFHSFFSLLGGPFVEFWWCFEGRGPEMCTFGLSGCRVKPRRPHQIGPPKFWAPHPFLPPPFGAPTLRGPHPSPTFSRFVLPPFGAHPEAGPHPSPTIPGLGSCLFSPVLPIFILSQMSFFFVPFVFFCPGCNFLFCPRGVFFVPGPAPHPVNGCDGDLWIEICQGLQHVSNALTSCLG